jgi:hypothetical protein
MLKEAKGTVPVAQAVRHSGLSRDTAEQESIGSRFCGNDE